MMLKRIDIEQREEESGQIGILQVPLGHID
jgi:hypothetical protein